ncbi:MAG: M28 family peptidase [Bryobacteraceae bacterium]|nr:M28 family peptidase [Bryobacteraceae bacterium]MDW8377664.1 M28 family peptidase [Bryobacterales bacterium]
MIAAALALLAFSQLPPLAAESKAGWRWWRHIEFLASDQLQGRETGSAGHEQAARYVATEFERAGLQPLGGASYLHSVKLRSQRLDESASSLEIFENGQWNKLTLGEDAYFSLRANPAADQEVEAVFAGYGFSVPERDFDEFRGLEVRGKLVVYVSGMPKELPAALASHYQSAEERWKRVKQLGGVGLAVVNHPTKSDLPWERASQARLLPAMLLPGSDRPPLNLALHPERTLDRLLGGSGYRAQQILEWSAGGQPLPKFSLKPRLRARMKVIQGELESHNVAGVLKGHHPQRQHEYLVISAHLDHLGISNSAHGDQVFNGAMDNASGVASLIELARLLRGKRLDRSVIFLAVTAEEKGLLGSQCFVQAPPVPREAIVANLNFDMFLPLFPLKRLIVYGLDESTLGDAARRVIEKHGLTVMRDPEPARNSFIRSDQYSFIRRGIPALSFKFGYAPGSAEETIFKRWLRERYHALSDDLQQPVDRHAAARFNRVMADLAQAIAKDPVRPTWRPESIFRRYAEQRASNEASQR